MFKKIAIFTLCLASILSFASCSSKKTAEEASGKVKVTVTFNALAEFAEAVGGDKIEVSTIIPDGTEPHDFEPKAQDLVGLSSAEVFVYNGLGMESWVADTITAVGNKELFAVDASKGITPIGNAVSLESSEHGQYDPHIWLSLKCAEIEVANIKDALVKSDPANKDYYETNSADYTSKIESLYNEYAEKFGSVSNKTFVTGHAAFAYLCRDFALTQLSVEDVFAEGEPSAQQLTELVSYCKKSNVTTVFAEKMASPEVSATLASEVGARVETIYTIESAEDDMSYLERMESNLSKIYASLAG